MKGKGGQVYWSGWAGSKVLLKECEVGLIVVLPVIIREVSGHYKGRLRGRVTCHIPEVSGPQESSGGRALHGPRSSSDWTLVLMLC